MFAEIEPSELAITRQSEAWLVLDVREDWEREIVSLPDTINIPLGELVARVDEIPDDGKLAVLCHGGMRSAQAAGFLAHRGRPQVFNVTGGIDRWAVDVEPSLPRY
ncbi:MAG: rhodanese-like domain-containing protein [Pseudomonadota bacterium]